MSTEEKQVEVEDNDDNGTTPENQAAESQDEANQEPAEETLESLRAERDDYIARWQRSQADCHNIRRRAHGDLEARVRMRMQPLLESILLVMDNLDMALLSPAESVETKNLALGVRMTRDQLITAIGAENVKSIDTDGPFDPALHQAMEIVESADHEPGSIVACVRDGYTWQDVVLRSAQVNVAKGEDETE
ncbi:MAG: nucleotide exchange factor GrpE [Planctomycetota bacterium]|nr:nucleotide exchange factor GrpE [Planctomycetota bacterium]MDG2144249.1 nucleotide exchange factor GrpE [Planctomycetota bacterium]